MGPRSARPIVRDWTGETLTLTVTNALGEQFYFEFPPEGGGPKIKSARVKVSTPGSGKEDQHPVICPIVIPIA